MFDKQNFITALRCLSQVIEGEKTCVQQFVCSYNEYPPGTAETCKKGVNCITEHTTISVCLEQQLASMFDITEENNSVEIELFYYLKWTKKARVIVIVIGLDL